MHTPIFAKRIVRDHVGWITYNFWVFLILSINLSKSIEKECDIRNTSELLIYDKTEGAFRVNRNVNDKVVSSVFILIINKISILCIYLSNSSLLASNLRKIKSRIVKDHRDEPP